MFRRILPFAGAVAVVCLAPALNFGCAPSSPDSLEDPAADEPLGPRGGELEEIGLTVFVSSVAYDGNLSEGEDVGIYGADAKCQALADAAGLDGKYRAWLGTGDEHERAPAHRFEPRLDASNKYEDLMDAGVSYHRVDGVKVANSWADLTDGSLLAPINLDESGVTRQSAVWTSTRSDGELEIATTMQGVDVGQTCAHWTSNDSQMLGGQGLSWKSGFKWTDHVDKPCNNLRRLYCFEQAQTDAETTKALSDAYLVYSTDFDDDLVGWKEVGDGQFQLESTPDFATVAGSAAYRGACAPGDECALHAPEIRFHTQPGAVTLTYDTYINADASASASIEAQIQVRDPTGELYWETLDVSEGPDAATSTWQSHTIDLTPYVEGHSDGPGGGPGGAAQSIDAYFAPPLEVRFVTTAAAGDEVGLDNMNAATQSGFEVNLTSVHRKVATTTLTSGTPPPIAWAENQIKAGGLFLFSTTGAFLEAKAAAQLLGAKYWYRYTDQGLPTYVNIAGTGGPILGPPGTYTKYIGAPLSGAFAVCGLVGVPNPCPCSNNTIWTVECQSRVAWASHTPHDTYLNGLIFGPNGPDSNEACVDPNPVSVAWQNGEAELSCDLACEIATAKAHQECASVAGQTPTYNGQPQTQCCQLETPFPPSSTGPTPPPDQAPTNVSCSCDVKGYLNRVCTETVECDPNDPDWRLIRINCPWGYTDSRPCEVNECGQCDQNCDQIGGGCDDDDGSNGGPGGSGLPFDCDDPEVSCFPTVNPDGEAHYLPPFEGERASGSWACGHYGVDVGPLYPGGEVSVGAWECDFAVTWTPFDDPFRNGGFGCDDFMQDDDCEDTDLRLSFEPGSTFSVVSHCPAGTFCDDEDPADCPCPLEVEICGNGSCHAIENYDNCPQDCCVSEVGDPCGVCNEGVTLCDGTCEQTDIPHELTPDECTDGIDNDCDGLVDTQDASCPAGCVPEWNEPCDGADEDDCLEGAFECDGTCNDDTGVSEEICNDGCDNDGNGQIDDCTTGGGCSTNADCDLDLVCDTSTGTCVECVVDTDCGCDGQGNSCPECGSVCCGGSSYACTNNQECVWEMFAAETCGNGLDDDCDGVADEGCMIP